MKDSYRVLRGSSWGALLLCTGRFAAAEPSAPPAPTVVAAAAPEAPPATADTDADTGSAQTPEPTQSEDETEVATPKATEVDANHATGAGEPVPEIRLDATRVAGTSGSVLRAESSSHSISEKGDSAIVLPSEHMELAGEMAFVTSEPLLTERATRFSDLGLLRLRARRSFSDRIEAYLHTQLLAKQPSTSDEAVWQAGGAGIRAEVVDHFALGLGGNLGLLMRQQGWWWEGTTLAQYKHDASRHLRFLLGAGGSFTMLQFDRGVQEPYWLQELDCNAEVQAGDDNAAMWVALNYSVPLASSPSAAAANRVHGYLDPQVRLGLDVGGSMSVHADDWDAYAVYSVVDRGDIEDPATLLPILDGGFDQIQVVIGVQYQFGPEQELDTW